MQEDKFIKKPEDVVAEQEVVEQDVSVVEDPGQIVAEEDFVRRVNIQTEADVAELARIRRQIQDGEADVVTRNAEWSENAKKVEAAQADQVERDIINGEYKWDGNLTQAENLANMRRAEEGVRTRNKAWAQQKIQE